ncbi:hypothetical protein [Streptomyces sp. NPDC050560]
MVDAEPGRVRSGRLRRVAARLALALGARALWALVVKLLDHEGVDL